MPLSRLSLVLLLASGCTWVTPDQFEARLGEVDDDGDGDLAHEDCDDLNPAIGPSQIETWYNGVDNDCDKLDDYDQDRDGFVSDEYVGLTTTGVEGTGALPGGDCNDTVATVSPIQPDAWYDGLDQDCDGADDFDQDADGYVPDEYQNDASLPPGDCDDLDAEVSPAATDVPYDGVDTDCGGNDDYDQDGDLYVPFEQYDAYGPTTYVDGSGLLPNGDCNDEDASMNPAAAEQWYDGVDSNCGLDGDYDQDGDGYLAEGQIDGGDDCDDTSALVFPGGVETLGDSGDGDCNGDPDAFDLAAYGGYTWTGPIRPVFAETGGYVYASVAATQIDTDSVTYYDSAIALRWNAADPGGAPDGVVTWNVFTSNTYTLTDGHDFAAADGYLYGALGVLTTSTRSIRLARYDLSRGQRIGLIAQSSTMREPFDDLDLVLDAAGTLHVVGCDETDGWLHYLKVADISSSTADTNQEVEGISASTCALDFHDGDHVFTGESTGILDYTFDATAEIPSFTGSAFSATYMPLDLDIPDDWTDRWLVVADARTGNLVAIASDLSTTLLESGADAVAASLHESDDGTLWLAWADSSGEAWLSWGDPATSWSTAPIGAAFAVTDVALWADGDAVYYAAVGANEVAVGAALR